MNPVATQAQADGSDWLEIQVTPMWGLDQEFQQTPKKISEMASFIAFAWVITRQFVGLGGIIHCTFMLIDISLIAGETPGAKT